jgi:hypothetical protein
MPIAEITDVLKMSSLIKDNWSLSNFWGNCEAEMMVAQTIHACCLNYKEHGQIFSFKGANVNSIHNGGLINNARGYNQLVDGGMFIEGTFNEKPVIYPTQALLDKLLDYFTKKAQDNYERFSKEGKT